MGKQRIEIIPVPRDSSTAFNVSPDRDATKAALLELTADDGWRIVSLTPLVAGYGTVQNEPGEYDQLVVAGRTGHGFSYTTALIVVLESTRE